MLLSMRSQRVGHDLATEQQQVLHVTQSLGGVDVSLGQAPCDPSRLTMGGHVGCAQYKGAQLKRQLIPSLFSNQAEHLAPGYNHLREKWPLYNSFVPRFSNNHI